MDVTIREGVSLRVADLRFTHEVISPRFRRQPRATKKRLALQETFAELLFDVNKIKHIPQMAVMFIWGQYWVVNGNRRLFVYKMLNLCGRLDVVPVRFVECNYYWFRQAYTTTNHGRTVNVRAVPCMKNFIDSFINFHKYLFYVYRRPVQWGRDDDFRMIQGDNVITLVHNCAKRVISPKGQPTADTVLDLDLLNTDNKDIAYTNWTEMRKTKNVGIPRNQDTDRSFSDVCIRVEDLKFSRAFISPRFGKDIIERKYVNPRGPILQQAFFELLLDINKIHRIAPIDIVFVSGRYWAVNRNRRLFVYKMLNRCGRLNLVPMQIQVYKEVTFTRTYNSTSHGESVQVRGVQCMGSYIDTFSHIYKDLCCGLHLTVRLTSGTKGVVSKPELKSTAKAVRVESSSPLETPVGMPVIQTLEQPSCWQAPGTEGINIPSLGNDNDAGRVGNEVATPRGSIERSKNKKREDNLHATSILTEINIPDVASTNIEQKGGVTHTHDMKTTELSSGIVPTEKKKTVEITHDLSIKITQMVSPYPNDQQTSPTDVLCQGHRSKQRDIPTAGHPSSLLSNSDEDDYIQEKNAVVDMALDTEYTCSESHSVCHATHVIEKTGSGQTVHNSHMSSKDCRASMPTRTVASNDIEQHTEHRKVPEEDNTRRNRKDQPDESLISKHVSHTEECVTCHEQSVDTRDLDHHDNAAAQYKPDTKAIGDVHLNNQHSTTCDVTAEGARLDTDTDDVADAEADKNLRKSKTLYKEYMFSDAKITNPDQSNTHTVSPEMMTAETRKVAADSDDKNKHHILSVKTISDHSPSVKTTVGNKSLKQCQRDLHNTAQTKHQRKSKTTNHVTVTDNVIDARGQRSEDRAAPSGNSLDTVLVGRARMRTPDKLQQTVRSSTSTGRGIQKCKIGNSDVAGPHSDSKQRYANNPADDVNGAALDEVRTNHRRKNRDDENRHSKRTGNVARIKKNRFNERRQQSSPVTSTQLVMRNVSMDDISEKSLTPAPCSPVQSSNITRANTVAYTAQPTGDGSSLNTGSLDLLDKQCSSNSNESLIHSPFQTSRITNWIQVGTSSQDLDNNQSFSNKVHPILPSGTDAPCAETRKMNDGRTPDTTPAPVSVITNWVRVTARDICAAESIESTMLTKCQPHTQSQPTDVISAASHTTEETDSSGVDTSASRTVEESHGDTQSIKLPTVGRKHISNGRQHDDVLLTKVVVRKQTYYSRIKSNTSNKFIK